MDTITYDDFSKLDIRVGQITAAAAPEWSNKLLEFQVDFGPEIGSRTILSGIKQYLRPEDLVGKKGIFLVNLAYRKMGPSESQGMMLMTDAPDQPVPIIVDEATPLGTVVR